MGAVFSCFASVFMWTGELLENVFIAVGEIGSLLVRGLFALLVGLCDVLAAVSCCCRVPYSQRPDRTAYDFHTLSHNVGRGGVYIQHFTPEGKQLRAQRKEEAKLAKEQKAAELKEKKEEEKRQKEKWAQEKKEASEKVKEAQKKEKEAKAAIAAAAK